MTKIHTLDFPFPEPPVQPIRLIPCFLSFAGCPTRCIYCNQHFQTGSAPNKLEHSLQNLQSLLSDTQGNFSLGFFGGTFTGLPLSWQKRFLNATAPYRKNRQLQHVRISTRPDTLDDNILELLQSLGVDMIELGIQSFDSQTLLHSKRGYTPQRALDACARVKDKGFALGIQLLPGLPGHSPIKWRQDVRTAISLAPEIVRLYPCIVMANTELEHMFHCQEYRPWTLENTVAEMGWGLLKFWEAGIRVIRLGLAAEKTMLPQIIAGPWHPALGNMARSHAVLLLLKKHLSTIGRSYRIIQARIPQRLSGDIWGHKKSNIFNLSQLGITPPIVKFWSKSHIIMELEA